MLQNQPVVLKRDLSYSFLGVPSKSNLNEAVLKTFPSIRALIQSSYPGKSVILDLEPLPDIFIFEADLQELVHKLVTRILNIVPFDCTVNIKTFKRGNKPVLSICCPEASSEQIGQCREFFLQAAKPDSKKQNRIRISAGEEISSIEVDFPVLDVFKDEY